MVGRAAAVVGGGIGGLAAAAGLLRAGWSVRLYEQATGFGAVGSGISLWLNALRALDVVGAGERVRSFGALEFAGGVWNPDGRIIRRADTVDAELSATSATMVHRADLLDALLDQVPADCRTSGVRVRSVRVENGRTVVEHDAGQSTVDLVVGADGVHSAVRASMWPDARPPRYVGDTAWRMIVPDQGAATRPGGETWGPGALFGVVPMRDRRTYCYATARVPAGGRAAGTELDELRTRFGGWHDSIREMLTAATPELVLRNDLYWLPPLSSYVRGRVVLLGDAAHAMTPHLGQGGGQALEDAATLATLLRPGSDVDEALRRYDELRLRRTRAMVIRSRRVGRLATLRSPVAAAIRDTAVRLAPSSLMSRSLTRMLDWHPPI